MPRFAANLSTLYPDLPFLQRFEAAARDGFKAVEYLFPYETPAVELRAILRDCGLQQVLFNTPPGGLEAADCAQAWAQGWRGTGCVPGREAEFKAGLLAALDYAQVLDCPRVHCMVGLRDAATTVEQADSTLLGNLRWAAQRAHKVGVELLIEPINPRSVPGFHLNRQDHAHALLQALDAPNVKVQMDLFHCQIVEGDLSEKLRRYLPQGRVGHLQIADVPQRNEPGTGELNWPYLFQLIDALAPATGWSGWLGCEYIPADTGPGGTTRGLAGWLRDPAGTANLRG